MNKPAARHTPAGHWDPVLMWALSLAIAALSIEPGHSQPVSDPSDDLGGWAGTYRGTGSVVFTRESNTHEPFRDVDTLAFEAAVSLTIDTTSSCLATEIAGEIVDSPCDGCWYINNPECPPATIHVQFDDLLIVVGAYESLYYTPTKFDLFEEISMNHSSLATFSKAIDGTITGTIRRNIHFDLAPVHSSETTTLTLVRDADETAVGEDHTATPPQVFALAQNYPNPFNPETTIRFDLYRSAEIDLALYDLAGQRVSTLAQGMREAGTYTLRWDGRDNGAREMASGVYLYRLTAGDRVASRKLLLLR